MQSLLFAISKHNGVRLEELAAALVAVAGALMLLGASMPLGKRGGQWLAGLGLIVAGVLAVIGLHWGHVAG